MKDSLSFFHRSGLLIINFGVVFYLFFYALIYHLIIINDKNLTLPKYFPTEKEQYTAR